MRLCPSNVSLGDDRCSVLKFSTQVEAEHTHGRFQRRRLHYYSLRNLDAKNAYSKKEKKFSSPPLPPPVKVCSLHAGIYWLYTAVVVVAWNATGVPCNHATKDISTVLKVVTVFHGCCSVLFVT